ncbi:MAG: glycosyltransferase family 2 protein [Eubacteriales bacterium]|nr:glycosyltransferase family 2 protein [Eubacteriales bacterium]
MEGGEMEGVAEKQGRENGSAAAGESCAKGGKSHTEASPRTAAGRGPQVAVIVPVYNKAHTIRRCIESILGQTYRNLELWLIDDGSGDGSGELCDAAAGEDGRVHVVHKDNEGLMKTWMRGVSESTAPYLSFVDADDWIEPDMIEKFVRALPCPEHPEYESKEVICGSYVIEREWNGTSEAKTNAASPGVYEGEKLAWVIMTRILGNEERTVILSRCMKLFSRELIERNLSYCDPAIRMGEDVNIVLPALLDARRVVILPDACDYHYVYEQGSMVHSYDPGLYDNVCRLRDVIGRILEDKQVPGAQRMKEQEFLFLLMLVMKNELRRQERDSASRIQMICVREKTPLLLQEYGLPLQEPANRLIAFFMRRPTMARIMPVRMIFRMRQKRENAAVAASNKGEGGCL